MIKRMLFKDLGMVGEVLPIYLFVEDNLAKYQKKYPVLLSDYNIERASSRFGTKKENLVLIELSYSDEERKRIHISQKWEFRVSRKSKKVDEYELRQVDAVMLDGASTPITIGDIRGFGPNVRRGFWGHDGVYALFHSIARLMADRWFTCFLEEDGTNRRARMIMHSVLRLFGGKARSIKPEDHWNYGRMRLFKNGIEIKN